MNRSIKVFVLCLATSFLLGAAPLIAQDMQPNTWTPVETAGRGGDGYVVGQRGTVPGNDAGCVKYFRGVDENSCLGHDCEPHWQNETMIPWEAFAFGEYIGPYRGPHVPVYRVRVDDDLEFVYQITREQMFEPFKLGVGDHIRVNSSADESLNQGSAIDPVEILPDGSISLRLIGRVMAARKTIEELQDELNERYKQYFAEGADPAIIVSASRTDTRLQDLINAVDARFGTGGQSRPATVSPDGTVQLPMLGAFPAVGLTLDELAREVNMRYRELIFGVEVTPMLTTRAPRFVYVLGEVAEPGQFTLQAPTTVMQAIALAGGWNPGGNLRQVIVFRRDHNWRLMAIRLDLSGGLWGRRPLPSDEIWLRDSDVVLIPKMPITRIADAVNLYFTQSLYGILPVSFVDGVSIIGGN